MKRTILSCLLLAASPAMAVDDCLLGVWRADGESIAANMATMMTSQMGAPVTARFAGGDISLDIDAAGLAVMRVDNLQIAIAPPGSPDITVAVTGYSEAVMTAEDGATYSTNVVDYSLSGAADFMGQRMEIPFESGSGMGGASSGGYACAGDTLTFTPDVEGTMPSEWARIR